MSALEILRGARALLVDKGWVQGVAAVDGDGYCVGSSKATVCRLCALGAIWRSAGGSLTKEAIDVEAVMNKVAGGSIAEFNDAPGRTKDEVLAAFDKAIASLEAS